MLGTAQGVILIMVSLTKTKECLSGVEKLAFEDVVFIFCVFGHPTNILRMKHVHVSTITRMPLPVLKLLFCIITLVTDVKASALPANPASSRNHKDATVATRIL
jgi:hypothetical protein